MMSLAADSTLRLMTMSMMPMLIMVVEAIMKSHDEKSDEHHADHSEYGHPWSSINK